MKKRLPHLVWAFVAGCAASDDAEKFTPQATVPSVGADPLAGSTVTACPLYLEEKCEAGKLQRCDIYDAAAASFPDQPDPLLRRVFLYDRWYDLYSSPSGGLTAERVFTTSIAADAPESVWGDPSRFLLWVGTGDSGIWTGAALVSDTFRYVATRTEADYQRMERKTRTLLNNFEVTGVPGYMARHHFMQVTPTTPRNDQILLRYGEPPSSTQTPIANDDLPGLPREYKEGIDDGMGGKITGTVYWEADVSIDQYTGPMTAFPIVYSLLRDEEMKSRIAYHMTCYLKRLQRIEIINLKARPDLITTVQNFFGGTVLRLDPGDPNLLDISKITAFVHRGINANNAAHFDRTCPDGLPLEPSRVFDARSPTFESELLDLATDINRDIRTRDTQIDHFYIATLRGGDASHLMHLAAMAYYFTGEEKYRSFLFDELIGKLHTDQIAQTMVAFRKPDWCESYFGDHITYGTHWQLISMLPEGHLKDEMLRAMHEELWEKALYNHESAKFNTMYASVQSRPEREGAIASVVRQLEAFGGNGGTQDAPRRTYSRTRASVIAALPEGITPRCPTEEQRKACEEGVELFGLQLSGESISRDCDGRAGECMMSDGKCTDALASSGLPSNMRNYADFMWQRSPFDLGEVFSVNGQLQSPGRDLSEPYWLARYYGYIDTGRDQVLAWREAGTCP